LNPWIELCGWTSTALIVTHMLPQLKQVIREGHAAGLSLWMLRMWLWAEIVAIPYVIYYKTWAIMVILVMSTIQALIFIHYKKHPRTEVWYD